jgi:hypothetical protein
VLPACNLHLDLPGVQVLQRRLGNEGTLALVARSSMRVSSPHDPAEREATAKASEVMRMTSPAVRVGGSSVAEAQRCDCPSPIQRKGDGPAHVPPTIANEIQSSMSGGAPLPRNVRAFMEPRFGADFGGVRIHTGEHAENLSQNLNAHAFTVGNHVFFGKGQFRPESAAGKELIAHELTHTIQQGASVQRSPVSGGNLVQRNEDSKSFWESLTDWGEGFAWDMVRTVAPDAVPILQKGPSGVLDWIAGKVSAAADGVFNTLMAPVRAISGVGDSLSAIFSPMVAALQVAAGQIARNDCTPIREAAEKIDKMAVQIITPIVAKVQPVVAKVKDFLNGLWVKIGAPIWGWIQKYAKDRWDEVMWLVNTVQKFYSWIWDKTSWIRSMASKAWTWVKNKLGIGDGPDGHDGLLQWVQGKLEAAWNVLKAKLEPFKNELTAIGAAVVGFGGRLTSRACAGDRRDGGGGGSRLTMDRGQLGQG